MLTGPLTAKVNKLKLLSQIWVHTDKVSAPFTDPEVTTAHQEPSPGHWTGGVSGAAPGAKQQRKKRRVGVLLLVTQEGVTRPSLSTQSVV